MTGYKEEKYWSKFANTFDEDQRYIIGGAVQQAIFEKLSEEKNLGDLIELGCGTGFYTKVLASNASHVTATDLSNEMLAIARTQLKDLRNVAVEKTDCEKIDFPNGKFDSVFMANVVHVVENPSIVLQESYRIIKDKGLLIIVSYTTFGMKRLDKIKMAIRFLRKWGKPLGYFQGNLSPEKLRSIVESSGFQVVEVRLIGDKNKGLYLKGIKR